MRRIAFACVVVCMCMTTAVAWGATSAHAGARHRRPTTHSVGAKAHQRRPQQHKQNKHKTVKGKIKTAEGKIVTAEATTAAAMTSSTTAPTPSTTAPTSTTTAPTSTTTAPTVLLGNQTVQSVVDDNAGGMAEAFSFIGLVSGQAQTINVYVDAHNAAKSLIAGLYSDNSGHPGTLLASGTVASPKAGAWNAVSIAPTTVTSGQSYWLAVLGKGGFEYFRDKSGSCQSETSSSSNLASLPATWKQGSRWQTCSMSAYIGGTGATLTKAPGSVLPLPPVNVLAPQVSGTTTQGQTLTTSNGTWVGTIDSYAYAWQDCDTSGGTCTTISGATRSTYQLTGSDVGHTIRALVTATTSGGSASTTSLQTGTVAAAPVSAPTNSAAPAISGTATQGSTLTTSNGTWTGSPTSYAFAWQDCNSSGASCTTISGATSGTYTLAGSDVGHTIRSVVTASNSGGSNAASSGQSGVVQTTPPPPPPPPAAPTNTTAPQVSGTATQGNTLTTTNGSWTGSPTKFTYAWQDCNASGASCAGISGATASSYTLQASDVGDTVRSVVTATNSGGSASASSSAVGPIASSGTSGGGGTTTGSGLVPCPLTHAGGADPANSCWATHTGVFGSTGVTEAQIEANPAAVGFTKHNGDLTITAPNTTIDHMWINGCISIADGANNTVIKNSLVTSGGGCSGDDAGGSAINTGQGSKIAKNTLIEDVTVDGGKPAYGSHDAGITLDGGTALRVNLFGFAQGFISDSNTAQAPALFQDDYGHDYYGCSHDDGTWFNSSSYVTFEHGWIMTNDPTQQGSAGCSTGALTGGSDYGPQDHVVFDNSYGEGVTGEDTHAGCGSTNSAYTNNALSNNMKDYGSGFGASNPGNSWAKNYVAETGASVSDPEDRSGC